MPEQFDGTSTPRAEAPKPTRLGGSQGTPNDSPSAKGAKASGTDNIRANYETYEAGATRPTTSSLRATRAAVATFNSASV